MNRSGNLKRNARSSKFEAKRGKDSSLIQELMAPKNRAIKEQPLPVPLPMTNRCCYANDELPSTPEDCQCTRDFSQIVEMGEDRKTDGLEHTDQYQQILREQYGFDPCRNVSQQRMDNLKGLLKSLCAAPPKVENSSQYVNPKMTPSFVETSDGTQWMNIDNADEIDRMIGEVSAPLKGIQTRDTSPSTFIWPKRQSRKSLSPQRDIHISETPRVKIIAEKFSKMKKNEIEIRKLEEKVVCVEYDVFETKNLEKPIQKLRAFFSIKPMHVVEDKEVQNIQHKDSKTKFIIDDKDLKRLTDKEIEIIDGKIVENQSYLKDLRHILRQKQLISQKRNRDSLDLKYLYEMARNDRVKNDSKINFLSKGELKEVKDLILNRCTSSVYGINRHTVKPTQNIDNTSLTKGASFMSQSFFNEILRETNTAF